MPFLSDFKPGEVGRILALGKSNKTYRKKLLAMGLTPRAVFTVIRRAPLGDPIEICIRDYHLSLRQAESAFLEVERVEGDGKTSGTGW